MKKILKSVLVLACLVVMPIAASAAPIADTFEFELGKGLLNYTSNSTGGILTGLNIPVPFVQLKAGDVVLEKLDITNGLLTFQAENTGNSWEDFNAGSLTLSGSVLGAPSEFLLTGKFEIGEDALSKKFYVNFLISDLAEQLDTKYFNVSAGTQYEGTFFLEFANAITSKPGADFSVNIKQGDITGQPVVPIPAAAWLFLSGFAGLAGLRRRNKK